MKQSTPPYSCHLIICQSCANGKGLRLKKDTKSMAKDSGLIERGLRVSGAQCLGLCHTSGAAVLYPQNQAFNELTESDIPFLLEVSQHDLE